MKIKTTVYKTGFELLLDKIVKRIKCMNFRNMD